MRFKAEDRIYTAQLNTLCHYFNVWGTAVLEESDVNGIYFGRQMSGALL